MNGVQQKEFGTYLNDFYKIVGKIEQSGSDNMIADFKQILDNIVTGKRPLYRLTLQVKADSDYDNWRLLLSDFILRIPPTDRADAIIVASRHYNKLSDDTDHSSALLEKICNILDPDRASRVRMGAVGDQRRPMEVESPGAAAGSTVGGDNDPIEWLRTMLQKLVTKDSEEVLVRSTPHVDVQIRGSLPIQYAARSFLVSLAPDARPFSVLENPRTINSTYRLDFKKVQQAMKDQQQLDFTEHWLKRQGYKVQTGGKSGEELFVNVKPVENIDEAATRDECGISLSVASALTEMKHDRIVFPNTIQITAIEKPRDQLEFYYAEAKLPGRDRGFKQFVLDVYGRKTDKSNIALDQAQQLWPYFQRLDMLARRKKASCASLDDEATVTAAQEEIRANALKAQEQLIKEFDFKRQTSAASTSSLAREVAIVEHKMSAMSTDQPKSFFGMFRASAAATPVVAGLTEPVYERKFEEMVNSTLVLGPEAFKLVLKMEHQLSSNIKAIEQVLQKPASPLLALQDSSKLNSQALAALPKVPSAAMVPYHQTFSAKHRDVNDVAVGSKYPPLAEYFLVMGQHECPDLLSGPPVNCKERQKQLEAIGNLDLSQRLTEMRDFFAVHTPFYFILQLSRTLAKMMDQPTVTETAIEAILLNFGVNASDLARYKVEGMDTYNRFHIKFDALDLALNACMKNGVLLNPQHLVSQKSSWVYNPEYQSYAAPDRDGIRGAIEWHLNSLFRVGWSRGGNVKIDYSSYGSTESRGSTLQTAGSGSTFGSSGGSSLFGRSGVHGAAGSTSMDTTPTPKAG